MRSLTEVIRFIGLVTIPIFIELALKLTVYIVIEIKDGFIFVGNIHICTYTFIYYKSIVNNQ